MERSPDVGGGAGDEAGRRSGAPAPGARGRGPGAHPGEGSVRADPPAAEGPLLRRVAVLHPGRASLTAERLDWKVASAFFFIFFFYSARRHVYEFTVVFGKREKEG